jgi:hypothetical protein
VHVAAIGLLVALVSISHVTLAQTKAPTKGAIFTTVLDAAGDPLSGAEILLPTLDVHFTVPSGGALLIRDVPSGMYLVQARHLGYAIQNRIVRVGVDTPTVRFLLAPVSQTLDTVKVSADPLGWFSDFEKNRKRGLGQFFTKLDLKKSGSPKLSQFLHRATGVRVTQGQDMLSPDVVSTFRCAGGSLVVFLDGTEISNTPEFDINVVPTTMVAGMEIYTDLARIPARYRTSHDRCGTILLWTG